MSTITITAPAPALVSSAAPRLRITPRGRAVLTALFLLPALVAALVLGAGQAAEAGTDIAQVSFTEVTVQPGQSLWTVAQTVAPQADPSDVVLEIMALNNLASASVQPGDRLAIPTQYTD